MQANAKADALSALDSQVIRSIPPGMGFTKAEFVNRYGLTSSNADRQIRALLAAGTIKYLGKRPGSGGEKVYTVTC
jgi:predicted HTH transcriptional regulator